MEYFNERMTSLKFWNKHLKNKYIKDHVGEFIDEEIKRNASRNKER